jgi:hypothetical protein
MVRNSDSVPCYFVHSVIREGCILLPPSPAYLRDVVASCGPLCQRPPAIDYRDPACAGVSGAFPIASCLVDPSSTAFTPLYAKTDS